MINIGSPTDRPPKIKWTIDETTFLGEFLVGIEKQEIERVKGLSEHKESYFCNYLHPFWKGVSSDLSALQHIKTVPTFDDGRII